MPYISSRLTIQEAIKVLDYAVDRVGNNTFSNGENNDRPRVDLNDLFLAVIDSFISQYPSKISIEAHPTTSHFIN